MSKRKILKPQIKKILSDDYVKFEVEDYVANPVALLRINNSLTQSELAEMMDVSQAYISKIEGMDIVPNKTLMKIKNIIKNNKK